MIDVAQGSDIPRKKGAGLLFSDLLVVNKTDLAPYVGVDLVSMEKDVRHNRGNKPYLFVSNQEEETLESVKGWILALTA